MNDDQVLQFEEDPENVSCSQKKSFYSMFPDVETRKDKNSISSYPLVRI